MYTLTPSYQQPHHRLAHKSVQQFPLFKRQEARFSFPSGGITHMVCSGGMVTLVMVGNIIYRLNPSNPKTAESESHTHTHIQTPSHSRLSVVQSLIWHRHSLYLCCRCVHCTFCWYLISYLSVVQTMRSNVRMIGSTRCSKTPLVVT